MRGIKVSLLLNSYRFYFHKYFLHSQIEYFIWMYITTSRFSMNNYCTLSGPACVQTLPRLWYGVWMKINADPLIFKRKVKVSHSPNQIHLLERDRENGNIQIPPSPQSHPAGTHYKSNISISLPEHIWKHPRP